MLSPFVYLSLLIYFEKYFFSKRVQNQKKAFVESKARLKVSPGPNAPKDVENPLLID